MNRRLTFKEQRALRLEQKARMKKCVATARGHGVHKSTAENCDSYSVGCSDCPFKPALMQNWTAGVVGKIIRKLESEEG